MWPCMQYPIHKYTIDWNLIFTWKVFISLSFSIASYYPEMCIKRAPWNYATVPLIDVFQILNYFIKKSLKANGIEERWINLNPF